MINLLTKRIKLKLLSKLSFLNANFAVTLGYLNPVLNNSALDDNNREFIKKKSRVRLAKKNIFARVSRFFVHFLAVVARPRHETS